MTLEEFLNKATRIMFALILVIAAVLLSHHYADKVTRYVLIFVTIVAALGVYATKTQDDE